MRTKILVAATILSLLAATRADAASMYTITDLGTLPGATSSIATGINDAGQVVGYSGNNVSYILPNSDPYNTSSDPRSFLYSNGQMSQVANPYNGYYGNLPAGSINASGQVASVNQSINASGQVVSNFQPIQVPVSSTDNGVTTTTSATFTPVAINDGGQIAGSLTPPGMRYSDAGIYQNGKFFDISRALGLTGDVTTSVAINNSGSVLVSDFHPSTDMTSYLIYKADGTMQTLPGGLYTAMNNQGQAVNFSTNPSLGILYSTGGLYSNGSLTPLIDLIPPSSESLWKGLTPLAINDEGQIAVYGSIDGQTHAFLMTPVATPEPTSIALFGAAIASASLREWARRRSRQ